MWFSNIQGKFSTKNTLLNKSVALSNTELDNLVKSFDTIWDINFQKYKEEISSITCFPFKVVPSDRPSRYLKLGNLPDYSTFSCQEILSTDTYLSLGEYHIEETFHNFADYNGYTKIKLFLPLLGFVDVDTDECMDKYLQIRLHVDYATGKGIYILGVSDNSIPYELHPQLPTTIIPTTNESYIRVISTYECQLGVNIPIGTSSYGELQRNLILGTLKTATGIGVAMYKNSLPQASTTTSSITTATKDYNVYTRAKDKGRKNIPLRVGTETETKKTTSTRTYNKPVDKSKPIAEAIDGSIDTLNSLRGGTSTDRVNDSVLSSVLSGRVKIVIYRPKFVEFDDYYAHLYGYPLGEVRTLSDLSGYTEINSIHFEGTGFETITKAEIAMLEQAFSDGVYL